MRGWLSDKDHRWAMFCDRPGCEMRSDPAPTQHDLPSLAEFQEAGWFVAKLSSDRCPSCFALHGAPAGVESYALATPTAPPPGVEESTRPAAPAARAPRPEGE